MTLLWTQEQCNYKYSIDFGAINQTSLGLQIMIISIIN